MTVNQNPVDVIDHDGYPQQVVVISNVTINEGDLVFWDAKNFTARPVAHAAQVEVGEKETNSLGLMGVAVSASKPELYGEEPPLSSVGVLSRACIWVNSTVADSYRPFDLVTIGADAQTVTKVGATAANSVGVVIVNPPAVARGEEATPHPETIEGGGRIRIQLYAKHVPGTAV